MIPSLRVRANAKLNLFLRVVDRRPDGFHEIETIFQTISLADELSFAPDADEGVRLEAAPGSKATFPEGEDNLILRAARRLEVHSRSPSGVRVAVRKDIPLGGGLGGGSADAAAALVALNQLWSCGLSRAQLAEVGAELGSDIPYLLTGGTVLATGRGERLTPLGSRPELWFVLGISNEPLLTADVYAAWDGLEVAAAPSSDAPLQGPPTIGNHGSHQTRGGSRDPLVAALDDDDPGEVARLVHNDLEAAAVRLRPELAARRREMVDAGALAACVSGSGPTIFAVARDRADAGRLASAVGRGFDRVEIVRSRPASIEEPGKQADLRGPSGPGR